MINGKKLGLRKTLLVKRGQMEMIGLVIIVVLVITSMLFYMIYKMSNPEPNIKRAFMDNSLAKKMALTMIKTTVVDCRPYQKSLEDLIIDCARDTHNIICNYQTSCEITQRVVEKILADTLPGLGKNYTFIIAPAKFPDKDRIVIESGCARARGTVVQGSNWLSSDDRATSIHITLDVCEE